MKRLIALALVMLCVQPALAQVDLKTSALFGTKEMSNDWAPVDDHDIVGFELDFSRAKHPLSYVFRYQSGSASESIFEVNTDEIMLGARYTMLLSKTVNLNGYFGGGYSLLGGELDVAGGGMLSETASGYWIGGGLLLGADESGALHIGIDWTYSDAGSLDFSGTSIDTGGLTTALRVGWSF